MSNKLHASKGDKAVVSRLYFNMIILFGLLENFHCHCERRGSLNALPLDSYPGPCEAISLLGLLRSFLSLAMIFRVVIALLRASAHSLLADKTDYLSHADTLQRAVGYSLLSRHQMVI